MKIDPATVCPRCQSDESNFINAEVSESIDGLAYSVCKHCGTCYRPGFSRNELLAMIIAGAIIIFLAAAAYLWYEWTIVALITGLGGGWLFCVGCRSLSRPRKLAEIVELVPEDERKPNDVADTTPPANLLVWLNSCAASDRPRFRAVKRVVGIALSGIGTLMVFCAGAFTMRNFNRPIDQPDPLSDVGMGNFFIIMLVMMLLGICGVWFWSLGKGLENLANPAWKVLLKSSKSPILYLRSFEDDRQPLWTGSTVERKFDARHYSRTLEDAIVDVCGAIHPVVTIGKPGERIPPSGAARTWLGNAEWQLWVQDFISWANRVIMVMGQPNRHPGLAWEIQTIFTCCSPHKIVLIPPPNVNEADVSLRWQSYKNLLSNRLPDYHPDIVMLRYTSTWNAVVVTVKDYRQLPSEQKRETFIKVLGAIHSWKRPTQLTERATSIIVNCDYPMPTDEARPSLTSLLDGVSLEFRTPTSTRTTAMPFKIEKCPSCNCRVVYNKQGKCPSCGFKKTCSGSA